MKYSIILIIIMSATVHSMHRKDLFKEAIINTDVTTVQSLLRDYKDRLAVAERNEYQMLAYRVRSGRALVQDDTNMLYFFAGSLMLVGALVTGCHASMAEENNYSEASYIGSGFGFSLGLETLFKSFTVNKTNYQNAITITSFLEHPDLVGN